jgi:hypothetical protein
MSSIINNELDKYLDRDVKSIVSEYMEEQCGMTFRYIKALKNMMEYDGFAFREFESNIIYVNDELFINKIRYYISSNNSIILNNYEVIEQTYNKKRKNYNYKKGKNYNYKIRNYKQRM